MSRPSLRYALLADGGSDRALLPIIGWVLSRHAHDVDFPEPGFRVRDLRRPIREEMDTAIERHRCEVLFVHRDAERMDPEVRRREIPAGDRPIVRVVPVRMTEAWLLTDEAAIRTAANNPTSRVGLQLPRAAGIESLPDPKRTLRELLLRAAEVTGRRRKRFERDLPAIVHRVAELVRDHSPLRALPAFRRFEVECAAVLNDWRGALRAD